jgi:hypothetical protein
MTSSSISVMKLGTSESRSDPLAQEKDETPKTKKNTERKKPFPIFLKSLISISCKT